MSVQAEYDVLVIGAGIAGLSLALRLADRGRIAVLAKGPITEGASRYAQGGIAAVLDSEDSTDAHVRDTLAAGAGLCDEETVRFAVERGPQCIQWLIDLGVPFTRGPDPDYGNQYHLTREGGHSHRRIIHADDATGEASAKTLQQHVREHPQIDVLEHHIAVDLITTRKLGLPGERVLGAYVLDREQGSVAVIATRVVVLATGGASKVYLYTSNPDVSTGDGIAMAWRAGCRVANMEFVQFHPTCLFHPEAKNFLISEAVRGEGGVLLTPGGKPFMEKYSPEWRDLAPRDVVARAIHNEMEEYGYSHVLLDIATRLPAEKIKNRFPNIHAECLHRGIDITLEPIPVVPAAHYFCGGIAVNEWGRSGIDNLYAVGEVSCTGLHGANRLASTSLLEGLVWGTRAAREIEARLSEGALRIPTREEIPAWDESGLTKDADPALIQGDMQTIQNIMWHYVGLVRSGDRLSRAIRELRHMQNEIETFYRHTKLSDGLIGLRNAVEVALVVAQAARHNRQSRGCHYRVDSVDGGDRLL